MIVGLTVFLLGFPWCLLVLLAFGLAPTIPFSIPIVAGMGWVGAALLVSHRWTSCRDWDDLHRVAVVFGGIGACMVAGFVIFAAGGALMIDWIAKAVLNVLAVFGMARLGRQLGNRQAFPTA